MSRTSSIKRQLSSCSKSTRWGLTGCGLEVGRRVVALRDEDVVLLAALDRLIQGNRSTHELLLNLTQALEPRLQLQVVVGIRLGNGGDDGNVVALGADVVSRRHHGDVDIWRESAQIQFRGT